MRHQKVHNIAWHSSSKSKSSFRDNCFQWSMLFFLRWLLDLLPNSQVECLRIFPCACFYVSQNNLCLSKMDSSESKLSNSSYWTSFFVDNPGVQVQYLNKVLHTMFKISMNAQLTTAAAAQMPTVTILLEASIVRVGLDSPEVESLVRVKCWSFDLENFLRLSK